jgi:putative ABC transport system ATP-binding protein
MSEPVVSIHGLDHHLGRGSLRSQVLFDVSVRVARGEVVLVTGPSGSGKTTLLNLIGGLRSVQAGSLCVLGRELRNASALVRRELRRQIGFVFQEHHLLAALTVFQNVQMALVGAATRIRHDSGEQIRAILDAVQLGGRADRLPEELSVGERQRVAIARAMLTRPALVLADEPTASLDQRSGRRVAELLTDLARRHDTAVVLVSHDERIFDVADRTLDVVEGRVSERPFEVVSRSA